MSADDKKELMQYEEEQKIEWNKLILAHIKKLQAIPKPHVQFPTTIEKACEEYFALCQYDGVKPSVAGLSVALGTNRTTLLSWVRGEVSIESADVIQRYFNLLEVFDETALKDNRVNALAGVFNAKNNYDYKAQVEVKRIDDSGLTNEEIEKRYRLMHEIVEETPKKIEVKEAEISKPKKKTKKDSDKTEDVPF